MTAIIKQIHPTFVGEVNDVDLREPLNAEDVKIISDGIVKYGVLVFRGQNITDEENIDFMGLGSSAVGNTRSIIARERARYGVRAGYNF